MTVETPKIVRYKRRPLTEEQIARLKAVADLPDEQIDFSDIPEADDAFFDNAVRGLFSPKKQQITLRLDSGTIAWFKQKKPRGYQTEINRVLREYILDAQSQAREVAKRDAKQEIKTG